MAETTRLLSRFIETRTQDYEEPLKAGTPRGERIGFSKEKYKASLLSALTALSHQEISGAAHVSYGLLRKWHTESEFRDKMSEHARNFCIYFWLVIRKNANEAVSRCESTNLKFLHPHYSFRDNYPYNAGLALSLCWEADSIAAQPDVSVDHLFYAFEARCALAALRVAIQASTQAGAGRPKTPTTDSKDAWRKTALKQFSSAVTQSLTASEESNETMRFAFARATRQLEAVIITGLFRLWQKPKGKERSQGIILHQLLIDELQWELTRPVF